MGGKYKFFMAGITIVYGVEVIVSADTITQIPVFPAPFEEQQIQPQGGYC